jgi:hypothetical protein
MAAEAEARTPDFVTACERPSWKKAASSRNPTSNYVKPADQRAFFVDLMEAREWV